MSRHLIHQPLHGETRTFAETNDIAVSKLVGRGCGDVRNFAGRKRVLDAELEECSTIHSCIDVQCLLTPGTSDGKHIWLEYQGPRSGGRY